MADLSVLVDEPASLATTDALRVMKTSSGQIVFMSIPLRGCVITLLRRRRKKMRTMKKTALTLMLVSLILAGCATTGDTDESEPTVTEAAPEVAAAIEEAAPPADESSNQEEGEVPLPVAESEQPTQTTETVIVQATRHQIIHDLVAAAQPLLRDVDLQYAFTGKGKREVLRGRPVAFALWSEAKQEWSVAQIELPRPPVRWKPGR